MKQLCIWQACLDVSAEELCIKQPRFATFGTEAESSWIQRLKPLQQIPRNTECLKKWWKCYVNQMNFDLYCARNWDDSYSGTSFLAQLDQNVLFDLIKFAQSHQTSCSNCGSGLWMKRNENWFRKQSWNLCSSSVNTCCCGNLQIEGPMSSVIMLHSNVVSNFLFQLLGNRCHCPLSFPLHFTSRFLLLPHTLIDC